jgi:hypothetical protein
LEEVGHAFEEYTLFPTRVGLLVPGHHEDKQVHYATCSCHHVMPHHRAVAIKQANHALKTSETRT